MFAILISEENLPKIQEHQAELPPSIATFSAKIYFSVQADWYYISGIVGRGNEAMSWSTYPESLLKQDFEYDADKIKTDWNQIVQK